MFPLNLDKIKRKLPVSTDQFDLRIIADSPRVPFRLSKLEPSQMSNGIFIYRPIIFIHSPMLFVILLTIFIIITGTRTGGGVCQCDELHVSHQSELVFQKGTMRKPEMSEWQ